MTVKERLNKINRVLTAGKMTLDVRKYHLDFNIHDHVTHILNRKKDDDTKKQQKIGMC